MKFVQKELFNINFLSSLSTKNIRKSKEKHKKKTYKQKTLKRKYRYIESGLFDVHSTSPQDLLRSIKKLTICYGHWIFCKMKRINNSN